MLRICFICLGNICRSPMAEYIMKQKVKELGKEKEYHIESRATSYETDGDDIYPPAKRKLDEENIKYDKHRATRLEKDDLEKFDYFICMDDNNIYNVESIIGKTPKIIKLLDRDIADPWYTRDFNTAYNDIVEGINLLINRL